MKTIRILFIACLVIAANLSNGQSKSDKMYDVFSNTDGVTSFSFSKNMVDAINIDVGEYGDEQKVTGDLHQVRFMSYNPKKGELSGREFTQKAIGCLPKTQYRKYDGKDEDEDTEIWLLGRKKKFKECHVFTKNTNDNQIRIVVSFYGDFNVNDIEDLKSRGDEFTERSE